MTFVNGMKVDPSMILFSYERFNDNCSFQIKRNNDVIFHNERLSEKYNSELQNRASVLVKKYHSGYIMVHFCLEPLRRSDKGLYGCVFECPDDIRSESCELDVMYPPGPAECKWVKRLATFFEFKLQCVAQTGNPPGTIVCLDSESKQTSFDSRPLKSVTQKEIDVIFLRISLEQNVSCCSVSRIFPKSPSTCNDFQTISETVSPQSNKQDNHPSTYQQAPAAQDPTKSIK